MGDRRTRIRRYAALAAGLLFALAAVAGAGRAASGQAREIGRPCKAGSQARCLTVVVPLDRSGRVRGKVPLHVQVLPADGIQRGVVFLIAGGPGQAGTEAFDFGEPLVSLLYRAAFPGYTLVTYDDRGTGRSGALRCPPLSTSRPTGRSQVASCASRLGPRRDFYGTPDNARDLEAVRRALGYGSIALAGVSYGTELAVEYARSFPAHVERLLLDSVALLDRPDPLGSNVLSRIPATLRRYCAGGECKAATPDLAADVTALGRELERRALRGTVRQSDGGQRSARFDRYALLSLVVDADLSPGIALALPAAVHAARGGDVAPLLRLASLDPARDSSAAGVNSGVYLATTCRDGGFPWRAGTPVAKRRAILAAAIRALPPNGLGGFGRWAADLGSAYSCLGWPSPRGGSERSNAPYPDVPVLLLSGGFDMRTPTANAAALAKRFPRAHLVVVPRVGHSVMGNDVSGCALRAVRDWVTNDTADAACPPVRSPFRPVSAYAPSAGPRAGGKRSLALTRATLNDAVAAWLMTAALEGKRTTVAGLTHGKAAMSLAGIELTQYGIEPGVWLTGRIALSLFPPIHFSGSVTVSGPGTARGSVTVSGDDLRGVFGGKTFR
jgi:pimeloyl-ACP methyl ester carboxylesterase